MQAAPKSCGHVRGKRVVSRGEAVARIRAAVDARDESGSNIVIVARTDARQAESLDVRILLLRASLCGLMGCQSVVFRVPHWTSPGCPVSLPASKTLHKIAVCISERTSSMGLLWYTVSSPTADVCRDTASAKLRTTSFNIRLVRCRRRCGGQQHLQMRERTSSSSMHWKAKMR